MLDQIARQRRSEMLEQQATHQRVIESQGKLLKEAEERLRALSSAARSVRSQSIKSGGTLGGVSRSKKDRSPKEEFPENVKVFSTTAPPRGSGQNTSKGLHSGSNRPAAIPEGSAVISVGGKSDDLL